MARSLNVYLNEEYVGDLNQDDSGHINFQYHTDWINHQNAIPLSHSLPLILKSFNQRECQGFFGGILPEEQPRRVIAKNLGISANNDFAMLERIGGECAGAVTFMPQGMTLQRGEREYRQITKEGLVKILNMLPRRPLLAGEDNIRLSLAGAQNKIALCFEGGNFSIPLGNAPSTHILKPSADRFEGLVFNEGFCLKLAHLVGLNVPKVSIQSINNVCYLLVERYDRILNDRNEIIRLHQEDFCQALGIPSQMKYQSEGGPSFKNCFNLVREVSSVPVLDLSRLLDVIIFNYLIGNNDAHGKNFSLIYQPLNARLAPFYDIISTMYYPELSTKMAMKIGSKYKIDEVLPRHFSQFAEEVGLAKLRVNQRVIELAEITKENLSQVDIHHQTISKLSVLIKARCDKVADMFKNDP